MRAEDLLVDAVLGIAMFKVRRWAIHPCSRCWGCKGKLSVGEHVLVAGHRHVQRELLGHRARFTWHASMPNAQLLWWQAK